MISRGPVSGNKATPWPEYERRELKCQKAYAYFTGSVLDFSSIPEVQIWEGISIKGEE